MTYGRRCRLSPCYEGRPAAKEVIEGERELHEVPERRLPPAFLAEGVASRYGMRYLDALYKSKVYRPMHSIPDHLEKEREIAGNIGCRYRFNGESVLLIDDTCITGATKRECAAVLRAHGAGEIWSLVLGRMVNRKHLQIPGSYNG